MGRVALGVSQDGRLVAVKQVHPGFAHDPGFRSRFRREVQTSRMVSGAYTAAVMDADPDADLPWLASVFVAGPSLRQAIDAVGPLPVQSVRSRCAPSRGPVPTADPRFAAEDRADPQALTSEPFEQCDFYLEKTPTYAEVSSLNISLGASLAGSSGDRTNFGSFNATKAKTPTGAP